MEDLVPIWAVLAVMVLIIWNSLSNRSDASIQNSKTINTCQDTAISNFEFSGTFKEMRARGNVEKAIEGV